MRKYLQILAVVTIILSVGCSISSVQGDVRRGKGKVTVMAAASLSDAFTQIGSEFEKIHPDVRVEFNFAGSQQLAQQMLEGAPADVFASANQKQMDLLVTSGRVAPRSPRIFARNQLVVIVPLENPGGIASIRDLAAPGIKLILAAAEVPVGQYSQEVLRNAGASGIFGSDFVLKVTRNVVSYEENVKAVLTKVMLGEADAGIVYATDSALEQDKVIQIAIPGEFNTIGTYPIAPLVDASNPAMAQAFIDFVLSDAGGKVLAGFGFLPAGE